MSEMTVPADRRSVDDVLKQHVESLKAILGDSLVAVYLHGSLAHGGFNEHSDVDFLAVIREELHEDQLQALRTHHERLHDYEPPWSHRLEGSYAPLDELAAPPSRDGKGWWYLDNGASELERSRHDDTLVVRTTLVDDPVTLHGPQPSEIVGEVDRDALRDEVRRVMFDWGADLIEQPEIMSSVWYHRFVAMSYARMLQTLETGRISSKADACRWVAEHLEARWADLVARAIAERGDPAVTSREAADPEQRDRTLDFVRFALVRTPNGTSRPAGQGRS